MDILHVFTPNTSMAHVSLAKMYVSSCILPTTSGRIALGSTAPYNASLVSIANVNPPLICRKLSFNASSKVGAFTSAY